MLLAQGLRKRGAPSTSVSVWTISSTQAGSYLRRCSFARLSRRRPSQTAALAHRLSAAPLQTNARCRKDESEQPAGGHRAPARPQKQPPVSHPADYSFRTIWAAPQPRAARPLWSESGGRGGVSDLGSSEQPTAEASAASTSGSRAARTRNVALCARRPRNARWNRKRLKDTLGVTLERVSGVPPRGLE